MYESVHAINPFMIEFMFNVGNHSYLYFMFKVGNCYKRVCILVPTLYTVQGSYQLLHLSINDLCILSVYLHVEFAYGPQYELL
jgi:hypothetical protein